MVAESGELAPLSTRLETRPAFLKVKRVAEMQQYDSQNVVFCCFLWVSLGSLIRFRECPWSGRDFLLRQSSVVSVR